MQGRIRAHKGSYIVPYCSILFHDYLLYVFSTLSLNMLLYITVSVLDGYSCLHDFMNDVVPVVLPIRNLWLRMLEHPQCREIHVAIILRIFTRKRTNFQLEVYPWVGEVNT